MVDNSNQTENNRLQENDAQISATNHIEEVAPLSSMEIAPFSTAEEPPEGAPVNYPDAPYRYNDEQNENILLNSGHLQHTVTDFVLPGRDGFDLVIKRSYDSANAGIEKMRAIPVAKHSTTGIFNYTDTADYNHFSQMYVLGHGWRFMLPSLEIIPNAWRNDAYYGYEPTLHLAEGGSLSALNAEDGSN